MEYLLVDGYNMIHAWPELQRLADSDMNAAREKLISMLASHAGYRKLMLVLVFDAYLVKGNRGSEEEVSGIHVVYTKEAETADAYIERVTGEYRKEGTVRVATNDTLEQLIILGQGAIRMSAGELLREVRHDRREMKEEYFSKHTRRHSLLDALPEDQRKQMSDLRLKKTGGS